MLQGVFGALIVVYQTIAFRVPKFANCRLVFALYLGLLMFALGTTIGFAYQAAKVRSLGGMAAFYVLIGMMVTFMLVLLHCCTT